MTASGGLICLRAARAIVTAGLKWAPETTASDWIKKNRTKTCTRPISAKSLNLWLTNSENAEAMKNTSASVPMNSAT